MGSSKKSTDMSPESVRFQQMVPETMSVSSPVALSPVHQRSKPIGRVARFVRLKRAAKPLDPASLAGMR